MHPSFIASFVIRLFCDQPGDADRPPGCRVIVRHIQTGEERQFQRPSDALAFLDEVAARSQPASGTGGAVRDP